MMTPCAWRYTIEAIRESGGLRGAKGESRVEITGYVVASSRDGAEWEACDLFDTRYPQHKFIRLELDEGGPIMRYFNYLREDEMPDWMQPKVKVRNS
jgi:hypothetical protein